MVFHSCGELQSRRIKRKKIVPILLFNCPFVQENCTRRNCNKYRRAQGLNAWMWFTTRLRDETNCLRCKLINILRWLLTENNCTSKITSQVKIRWFFPLKNTCAYFLGLFIKKTTSATSDKKRTKWTPPSHIQFNTILMSTTKVKYQDNLGITLWVRGCWREARREWRICSQPCMRLARCAETELRDIIMEQIHARPAR